MLQIRGEAGGTTLTGTLFERGEQPPSFQGAPDEDAPYVWICDEFYEVESGGTGQTIAGREARVAFESPMPRGFDTREAAVAAAEEHVRTQFARVGVDPADVAIEVVDAGPDADAPGDDGSAAGVDGSAADTDEVASDTDAPE